MTIQKKILHSCAVAFFGGATALNALLFAACRHECMNNQDCEGRRICDCTTGTCRLPRYGTPCTDDGNGTVDSGTMSSTSTAPNTTTPATSGMVDTGASVNTTGPVDDTSATSTDPGISFIPPSPDGSCQTCICESFKQDCADGLKCMPWAIDGGDFWNATRCAPIDRNPGQPGDECVVEGSATSGIDSCDLGSMCWFVDPQTNIGTCVALCTGTEANPICKDPNDACSIRDPLALCLPSCDPTLQDCFYHQICHPADDFDEAVWVCSRDSDLNVGAYGDACEYFNVCNAGLVCLPDAVPNCTGSNQCCTEICELDSPFGDLQCDGWQEGQQCLPWYTRGAEPPGLENVGFCGLL